MGWVGEEPLELVACASFHQGEAGGEVFGHAFGDVLGGVQGA